MTLTLMINPQKYIVNCQEYVEPPSYLRSELHEEVTFDFTPIMKNMNQDTTDTIRRYERKNCVVFFLRTRWGEENTRGE